MAGSRTDVMMDDGLAVALAASATLKQCAQVLREVKPAAYAKPSQALGGGTIGQHVRHSLDHFVAALSTVDGHIDYDTRDRGTKIEADPNEAMSLIEHLVAQLDTKTTEDLCAPVTVHVMLSGDGQRAMLTSTLGRELWFASHHAIHHHAMIGAIAKELAIPVAPDFGKAPSTIEFECRTAEH
ncbi:MAG: hypothetical protein KDA20_01660 [Phycisphaerales bacterium]|nr:hypothetical protein [Phycisphaerales bacterium]